MSIRELKAEPHEAVTKGKRVSPSPFYSLGSHMHSYSTFVIENRYDPTITT